MSRRNFRILLVLSLLLTILSIVVSFATESSLPPELKSYLDAQANAPVVTDNIDLLTFTIVYLVLAFVVWVGLFLFKKWAKALLIPYFVLGILLLIFNGPQVLTGLASSLTYLSSLIDGIILALVYFSPVSRMFEVKQPMT